MPRVTQLDIEAAKEDLKLRTLEPIGYDFGRLIYMSSLRDLIRANTITKVWRIPFQSKQPGQPYQPATKKFSIVLPHPRWNLLWRKSSALFGHRPTIGKRPSMRGKRSKRTA